MVYTGKPSKGCSSCRERKIRCDLKAPSCGQCEKRQQTCPGYRNVVDLVFRDESSHLLDGPMLSRRRNRSASSSQIRKDEDVDSPDNRRPTGRVPNPDFADHPHPLPEQEGYYFGSQDARSQRPQNFQPGPQSMGNMMGQQFMYNGANGSTNGSPMFSAPGTGSESIYAYSNAPSSFAHIDPTKVFQHDQQVTSTDMQMQLDNMFSFGRDSDDEDDTFADRNMAMHKDLSSSLDESGSLGWDASLPGQFSTQAARFPGGPTRKQVMIGGTTTDYVDANGEWDTNGLARSHSQSFRPGNSRRQSKLTRNASTPSHIAGKQNGFEQLAQSMPMSPVGDGNGAMSGYSSVAPSRPSSPPHSAKQMWTAGAMQSMGYNATTDVHRKSVHDETNNTPSGSQGDQEKVLFHRLTCRSLCIGSWRCVGLMSTDLLISYAPEKSLMTYYILTDQGRYKIEFPFSYIKNIHLDNVHPGGIVIELSRPPSFFMDTSPEGSGFFQCGDFTEHQQASVVLTHALGGNPKILSGQLARLVSLPSFLNRHYVSYGSQQNPYPVPLPMNTAPEMVPPATFNAQAHPELRQISRDSGLSDKKASNLQRFAGSVTPPWNINSLVWLDDIDTSTFGSHTSTGLQWDAGLDFDSKHGPQFTSKLDQAFGSGYQSDLDYSFVDADRIDSPALTPWPSEFRSRVKSEVDPGFGSQSKGVFDSGFSRTEDVGIEFRCETCGYFPRGNPKYFKRSLVKHMKRHAAKELGSSSRESEEEETILHTDRIRVLGKEPSPSRLDKHIDATENIPNEEAWTEGEETITSVDKMKTISEELSPNTWDEYLNNPEELIHEWARSDREDTISTGHGTRAASQGSSLSPMDDDIHTREQLPDEWAQAKEDEAFTDSGYASARNAHGYMNGESSMKNGTSLGLNTSPSTMNGTDDDDTATMYSAGTVVAPARAQIYIAEICNDIYSNLKDCVNTETWPAVSKILPDLIKAFAVRLGIDCPVQVNRDIMYFVHQRHREVVSQLEAMFSQDTEEPLDNCRPTLAGMPLLDKMSLWRSRDDEDAKPQVEVDDYFHGVKDDEDEHDQIENIGLSVYQRVISDSQAYKWFISTCKKEVTLQQGATNRCTMTNESIRGSLLEKLPTGTISKRHAPSSHEVTFVLQSRQLIAMRLARTTVKPGTWPVQSFSNVVVLTGSVDHAQALTIKQYMSQTWPANGTQMLEALEDGITNPKNLIYGKSPANTPLVVGIQDALLMVKARGPAYFIAECGEQLAWLASAFSTVHRNGLCGVTPLINKIHIWQAASRSSGCSGLCKLGVDSTAVFDLDHSLSPATESCWQALVGRLKLIQGYPIARRPEGYPGLEISLELLLSLVQAGKVSVHPTKVLIEGSKRSLQLVKRTDNVCLWHLVDSITECCACDKVPVVNNTALWKDRHILGSCKPQDDDDTRLMNTRPSGSICQSNAATKTKSITALDEEPPYVFGRRKEVVRKLSIRRASQVPVLEDHASATPVTLPRSHGSPQSAAEPDSGDDSFDTDQLSISDSSEPAERLDVNDPQYLALRSVLVRLLSGYRTRAQYPSPAQQNGQGAPTSAVNLSNSENRGTSNPNNWKRKRGDDDRDDADQDGFQRPPQKKINCDPAEAQKKSFACPFLKKDPVEHRDCCTRKLSRIRDVKQHLARRHTPERYCQLCFETSFADQRSLQHHISERSCLSQEPSTLEGISYDQRQQLSKKSNPNITEEGQWFVIWDIIFPESLKPTSAYLDTGLSVEMRLFREYSQTHGPVMIREQILASPYNMRQGSLEEQQSALDRVIAEGITRLFETWRSAQSTGSRPSRNQANNNAQAGQATPLSSIADSGFATASQVSPLEARSRIEGSVQNSSILETSCPPPAGMAAEIQDSEQAQGLPMGSSDIYNQDWFAILASTDNMGQFYTNRNEFELGSAFD